MGEEMKKSGDFTQTVMALSAQLYNFCIDNYLAVGGSLAALIASLVAYFMTASPTPASEGKAAAENDTKKREHEENEANEESEDDEDDEDDDDEEDTEVVEEPKPPARTRRRG